MSHYNFNKDIIDGKKGEDIVINYILHHNPNIQLLTNTYSLKSQYDAILYNTITDKKIQIEIKTDYYCKPNKDTGNIFIEYETKGKDSGINVTKSDIYMYYYIHLNELWSIPTYKLKSILYNNNYNNKKNSPIRKVSNSGDEHSNTKGYLLNRRELISHFNVVKVDSNMY